MELKEERQNLLDRLHDAVKQCQVRFGGKNELATESDSRVSCLLNQLEAILQHGMKKSRTRTSAFRQVGKVTGIMKQDPEPVFWHLVKEHLGKLEEDQFNTLLNINTDTGRGRSWLRSALNEQTLERFMRQIIGNKRSLSTLYEKEAFLLDEERSSMLPTMAAGLSSILFALNIDSEELNVVKQVPTSQAFTKDVLNTLLPPFVPKPPVEEPAPVYSGEISESKTEKRKKKKRKKVLTAAIVSIDDDGNEESEERTEPEGQEKSPLTFQEPKVSLPLKTKSFEAEKSDVLSGHPLESSSSTTDTGKHSFGLPLNAKITIDGEEAPFTTLSTTSSGSHFLDMMSGDPCDRKVEAVANVDPKVKFAVGVSTGESDKSGIQDEDEEVSNFNFQFLPGEEKRQDGVLASLSAGKTHRQGNKPDLSNSERGGGAEESDRCDAYDSRAQANLYNDLKVEPSDNLPDNPFVESSRNSGQFCQHEELRLPGNDTTKSSDFGVFGVEHGEATVPDVIISHSTTAESELQNSTLKPQNEGINDQRDADNSPSFASFQESGETVKNASFSSLERSQNAEHTVSPCDSPTENGIYEGKQATCAPRDMESESQSDPIVVLDTGESLVPVITTARDSKDLWDNDGSFRDSCDNSPGLLGDRADTSSLSSASWSWVEDCSDAMPTSKPELDASGESAADLLRCGAGDAALAALDACSDAQKGMSHLISTLSAMEGTTDGRNANEIFSKNDGMNTGELKQALVAMMLRKDETEEQNKSLRNLLDESRSDVEQLKAELEQSKTDLRLHADKDSRKIEALRRENELLKHQLRKYVGAVQMMRSDLQGSQFRAATEALAGIRQDEVLPSLPEQKNVEREESEKVEEYKGKLIQVSEMHGELLEFNERLHKQVNVQQFQIRRLRQELINLRGPLPEDSEEPAEVSRLSDFDPSVMAVNSRPLINVWIPSAFLRGRSSGVHHVYQLYVRIQDDEWNVYRRYSHFHDFHKKLRRKYSIVGSFKFPPKKTIGNKDLQFVDSRRRLLQDYLRRVVNFLVTSEPRLANCRDKAAFLKALPFFGDQFTSEKGKSGDSAKRKRSLQYTGL